MSPWVGTYILNAAGEPEPAPTLEWAAWYETAERQIALNYLAGDIMVSTIFTGLDSRLMNLSDGDPVLWETAVFRGPRGKLQDGKLELVKIERYSSREEALAGHEEMVKRFS